MNKKMRQDGRAILDCAIKAVLPDEAVRRALEGRRFPGRVVLIAAGKAAWQMANAAWDCLGGAVSGGVVITKYGHAKGKIGNLICWEAGHPVPDENSFSGTEQAIAAVRGLTERDTVLFLLSGGGSALFEKPMISGEELQDITSQLLACGADIVEINTIRKRLSAVKGGRFAQLCAPAQVFCVVLSDVLGDRLDMIASGPASPDRSTCEQARKIAENYHLKLSIRAQELLKQETPKELHHVHSVVTGSVRELCAAAARACQERGYAPVILTDRLRCQAREAGSFLASIAVSHAEDGRRQAFLAGGETVVRLTGSGKGGRSQELALAAAKDIAGLRNVLILSAGSDGTDGPTDAAGGIVDGDTAEELAAHGISIQRALENNDAYHALKKADGLVVTGPTGTNVNDIAILLIDTIF